ncbi:MAG: proton-conducting transporter membrane subunit [Haloferacaceae archaeon]
MSEADQPAAVAPLPESGPESTPQTAVVLTRLVWLLWVGSLGVVAARVLGEGPWGLAGLVVVDGLTVVLWTAVTFVSGIVHSYSRRYMAGSRDVTRFFTRLFGFTLVVILLVAADHLVLFGVAWLAMGLVMADLVGHVRGWPQAAASARFARRCFLAGTASLAVALGVLWWATGETTVSGVATAADSLGTPTVWVAAGALLLAAMVQSALVPFHAWLLSSMTAPTPASALMHAGFVNAGGLLLTRFAPVVVADGSVLLVVVVVGTVSALSGKLLKSVQPDIKRQLGCSTVGQMGFMIVQAGLGFFGAAITHLVLHGFYKAYKFLSAGGRVEHASPTPAEGNEVSTGGLGVVVTALTALAGGVLFAGLTGKGTAFDGGLVLTLLVVVLTIRATWGVVRQRSVPPTVRYVVVPPVVLAGVAVYAAVYTAVTGLMAGLPVVTAPADLTAVHGVVAVAFVVASVAVETGVYRRSDRLYAALVNAGQPPAETLLTAPEEYNEY